MMARALDANGASKVFIIGRREEALEKVASTAKHGTIIPIAGDVTSKSSLQSVADQVSSQVDHIDVLIANSGISGPSGKPEPKADKSAPSLHELREHLWAIPMEDFSQTHHVNITGAFYTAVAFLPLLDAANRLRPPGSSKPRPQIITTASIGAFNRRVLAGFAYSASKAGVTQMVKQMATEFAKFDIRSNAIAPGLYESEMTGPGIQNRGIQKPEQYGSFPREFIPLTRSGSEEDIAGVVLWLCSRAGSYVNGNIVITDGGRLSVLPASY